MYAACMCNIYGARFSAIAALCDVSASGGRVSILFVNDLCHARHHIDYGTEDCLQDFLGGLCQPFVLSRASSRRQCTVTVPYSMLYENALDVTSVRARESGFAIVANAARR